MRTATSQLLLFVVTRYHINMYNPSLQHGQNIKISLCQHRWTGDLEYSTARRYIVINQRDEPNRAHYSSNYCITYLRFAGMVGLSWAQLLGGTAQMLLQ